MTTTRATASSLLLPEDIGDLVVKPLTDEAVCTQSQVATVKTTSAPEYRIPVVESDAAASWVAEGQEIPVTDAAFGEELVRFGKLAALTVVTSEAIADAAEDVGQVIGDGLARNAARKLEAAYFGNLAAPAPAGLGALGADVSTVQLTTTTWRDLDPFALAASKVEQAGGRLTGWVANPDDVYALSVLKAATGSLTPLLAPAGDAAAPSRRVLEGLPVFSCAAVPAGTIYGLDASRTFVVIREDVRIDEDASAYFTSDRIAFRATFRVGFGNPVPATTAVVRLKTS